MRNKIGFALDMILDNFKLLIPLQIINQLLGVFLVYPFMMTILNYAYQLKGKIVISNIQGFELSLENILLFILVFIILGLYYFYTLSSFIILANNLVYDKRKSISENIMLCVKVIKENFNIELFKTSFIIAVIMPMSLLAIVNTAIIPIKIPEFILDFLRYSNKYIYLKTIVLILINTYALFLMFVLYDVFIENKTLKEAHHDNTHYIIRNIKSIGYGLIVILVTLISLFLAYILSTLFVLFVSKQFFSDDMGFIIFNNVHSVLIFIFYAFGGIILLSMVTLLVVVIKHGILFTNVSRNKLSHQLLRLTRNVLILSGLFTLLFTLKEQVNLQINTVDIVGHRMGILELPENSILGLEGAIERGYDMVEIDIQQLKDQEILVVHDPSFKRLAGVNKNVVELDYQEVLTFNPLYTHPDIKEDNQHFARLEEMLIIAKDKIELMIEVKTNPQDVHFLEDILALIEKHDMFDEVQLASMDKTLLKSIKEIDSEINTTYIATLVVGDKLKDDYIDNYSLQLDLITEKVINKIRAQEKGLYVWTPNNSKTITKALGLNIDGIVTDKPDLVLFHIKNPNFSIADEFWNNLFFNDHQSYSSEFQ